MIIKDSYLIVTTICSFVCFHVTADLNFNLKKNTLSFSGNNENISKRAVFQKPVLNNQSPPLTEDWVPDVNWPAKSNVVLGQVTGVTVNGRGEVVVFHRGDHVWDSQSFDPLNQYLQKNRGAISSSTVLVYHPETGELIDQWGENMFYLPHGITIDPEENLWLTDVALHQVFKFPPLHRKERTPLLTLGEPFVPGNSAVRFCKPTSVAVTAWGDFFVADGYCNSRLIKYNKAGEKILEIGHATFTFGLQMPDPYSFFIPHALTLAEDRKLVCVADRQNGRVLCFDVNNGTFIFHISSPQIGSFIYSVAYSPQDGGLFFVINGEDKFTLNSSPVRGYAISASNLRLLSYFGSSLKMPHDIAVSPDASRVYVVEIGPNLVHKYTHNGTLSTVTAPLVTSQESMPDSIALAAPRSLGLNSSQGSVLPAVLVTCAAILFGAAIVTAALVYSRARRKGCGHCGSRRWMLGRSPAEGFMIGHLLGQHQGFEKLSTAEESEEEITSLQPFA